MSVQQWFEWIISCISSAYNWLVSITLWGVPVLYILLGLLVLGVVLRAILYKA